MGPLASGTSLPSMHLGKLSIRLGIFSCEGRVYLAIFMVVSEKHDFVVDGDVLADSLDSAVNLRVHLSYSLAS